MIGTLDTNGYWAVNGAALYVPSSIEVEHDNIVTSDSGRMESGFMHIEWVRNDVRKVNLTYKHLTGSEVDYMLNLMQGKSFTFTYFDNGVKTMEAYVGKCTYEQKNLSVYKDEGGEYQNFKINVVEM